MNKETSRLRWYEFALCIGFPLLFGLVSIYRGQDANWDLRNYHLYNPYAFLTGRLTTDLAPAQLQSYFNPLLDLPYYFVQDWLPPRLLGFFMGSLHGLCFIWVMLIARRLVPVDHRYTASFLAVAGMCSCAFLGELGTTMGGPVTSLLILMSVWLLISQFDVLMESDREGRRRALALLTGAGVLCGLALGFKLVNAPYAVGACVALLTISSLSKARRVLYALVFGLAVLSGMALTLAYWAVTLYQAFGNPLFPQYNNIFHAPLAAPIGVADTRWATHGLVDALLLPFTMVVNGQRISEIKLVPLVWSVAYVLLILSLIKAVRLRFGSSRLTPLQIYFLCFGVVSFAVWLSVFTYHRYLMPIELLAPLLCWVLAHYLFGRSLLTNGIIALMGICAIVAIATAPNWGHSKWADRSFRVDPPVIAQPGSAVVLKVGPEPVAWLFPFFPRNTPILGIATNFPASPEYGAKVVKALKERAGTVYAVLSPSEMPGKQDEVSATLQRYGLIFESARCQRYQAFLGKADIGYLLCPLQRQQ